MWGSQAKPKGLNICASKLTCETILFINQLLQKHCPEQLERLQLNIEGKIVSFGEQLIAFHANDYPIYTTKAIEHHIWRTFMGTGQLIEIDSFKCFFRSCESNKPLNVII